jgi:potassium-dependent mechanosensitive channel
VNFELRFWLDVSKANAAQVASDLRLMISGTFAERGIVIAFPQREVRVEAARPLQVQVVASADQGPGRVQTSGPRGD